MNKLPKRKNIRLKDYDYSSCGYYFITICTQNRQSLFWKNITDVLDAYKRFNNVGADIIRPHLSECGKTVDRAINEIKTHYPYVTVDEYAIMPDHIHLILKIVNNDEYGRMISAPTLKPVMTIIGQMKRWVSKEIGFSVWQKSYYEHIIRDEKDYLEKAEYIMNNPLKYLIDKTTPDAE
ncbi:MAG: transposase [Clostridia bacterium]|nr:transposase [Clostridia bacterium]